MALILGIDGVNRTPKWHLGVDGVNKVVKELYLGVDGVNKQVYKSISIVKANSTNKAFSTCVNAAGSDVFTIGGNDYTSGGIWRMIGDNGSASNVYSGGRISHFTQVTINYDKTYMATCINDNGVVVSTNQGYQWSKISNIPNHAISDISYGALTFICSDTNHIYTSPGLIDLASPWNVINNSNFYPDKFYYYEKAKWWLGSNNGTCKICYDNNFIAWSNFTTSVDDIKIIKGGNDFLILYLSTDRTINTIYYYQVANGSLAEIKVYSGNRISFLKQLTNGSWVGALYNGKLIFSDGLMSGFRTIDTNFLEICDITFFKNTYIVVGLSVYTASTIDGPWEELDGIPKFTHDVNKQPSGLYTQIATGVNSCIITQCDWRNGSETTDEGGIYSLKF